MEMFVTLLVYFTMFQFSFAQQLSPWWSSEELQEAIPCYGQEMTNRTFHVGKKQFTSELMYNYIQVYQENYKKNLDCTFNHPGMTNGGERFGYEPYTWNIDRIDIISSGGMDCLGGGIGFPWYRFRLYSLPYTEFRASIWITWRGTSSELMVNPFYLVQCLYEGTTTIASPINY